MEAPVCAPVSPSLRAPFSEPPCRSRCCCNLDALAGSKPSLYRSASALPERVLVAELVDWTGVRRRYTTQHAGYQFEFFGARGGPPRR